jgi:hypothetical protein
MRRSLWRRSAARAALLCALASPAAALDVLEGLGPADFRVQGLAGAELRAFGEPAPLDPAEWVAASNPVARSDGGGPTITDVGIATVAAEVGVAENAREDALRGAAAEVDLRVLATPGLRDAVEDALDSGGEVDLGSLLDDLGQGGLDDALPLDEVLDDGLLDLPTDDLQDLIDELDDGVLGGLLGSTLRP